MECCGLLTAQKEPGTELLEKQSQHQCNVMGLDNRILFFTLLDRRLFNMAIHLRIE